MSSTVLDPVHILPPELFCEILSYLDEHTLLTASTSSKAWRSYCTESSQWKRILAQKGCIVKLEAAAYAHSPLKHTAIDSAESSLQPLRTSANVDWYKFSRNREHALRENWRHGRCTRFELPHASHASEGHDDDIYALHLRAPYLVSGGLDRTIRIWDLDTCRLIGEPLRGHRQWVLCLQFDPGPAEDVIFSGAQDGELICWKFSARKFIKRVSNAHQLAILCLKFTGAFVITGSNDKTIKVWNRCTLSTGHLIDGTSTSSPEALAILTGHDGGVNAIDCSGDTVVSASADHTIRVWSIAQKECLRSIEEKHSLKSVHIDGQTIVTAGGTTTTLYNDRLESKSKRTLRHKPRVRTMQARFRNESTGVIASGSCDGLVKILTRAAAGGWHAVRERPFGLAKSRIVALQFDDRRLACCSQDTKIVGWDFANGDPAVTTLS